MRGTHLLPAPLTNAETLLTFDRMADSRSDCDTMNVQAASEERRGKVKSANSPSACRPWSVPSEPPLTRPPNQARLNAKRAAQAMSRQALLCHVGAHPFSSRPARTLRFSDHQRRHDLRGEGAGQVGDWRATDSGGAVDLQDPLFTPADSFLDWVRTEVRVA